jgi:4-aminobutyrate aminotransferase/(S)-3-amino-2-methylpropionate transaminase
MNLVEFVLDRETRTPAPQHTLEIIRAAVRRGLIMIRAGLYSNCIRLLPPLVITEAQLGEALGLLEEAVAEVQSREMASV